MCASEVLVKYNRREKMNKIHLTGSNDIILLSAAVSPVWVGDNTSTFLPGHAKCHTNHAGALRGVRLENNHEISPDWRLVTSFS